MLLGAETVKSWTGKPNYAKMLCRAEVETPEWTDMCLCGTLHIIILSIHIKILIRAALMNLFSLFNLFCEFFGSSDASLKILFAQT